MVSIDILTGSALSDRAEQIDAYLIERLPAARLLVPTRESARQRMLKIVRSGLASGILGSPVLTFEDFVADLLRNTAYEQERIDNGAQRVLLERIVADMGRSGQLEAAGPAGTTAGFVNHLHRTISGLKQSAVDPQDFMRRTSRADRVHPLDGIVGAAYQAYQQALQRAGAYDAQGMYWMAHLACQDSLPPRLAEVSVLILDEFDDFTDSEFRLVKTLARHLERVVFGLVVDMDRSPEDQGRLVRQTYSLIESSFEHGSPMTAESREPASQIEFASLHLFGRTDERADPALDENIRCIECYNPRHEAETVAREIKRTVREHGIAPNRIAVVHADASTALPRFRMAFEDFGIPLNARGGMPLDMHGTGALIRNLFRALETWSRSDVLHVIASPFTGVPTFNAFESIAVAAGVTHGRAQWRERIERFRTTVADPDPAYAPPLAHVPDVDQECLRLLDSVSRLEQVADAFPNPCSAQGLVDWLASALETLNVLAAIEAFPPDICEAAAQELAAVNRGLHRLKRWYGTAALDVAHAERIVRQCLRDVEVPIARDRNGVWFGRPEDVRHLTFDLVICAGMSEGLFPSRPGGNAIYGDHDRAELAKLGIRLRDAEWDAHRQTGLFQRIFDCATRELILTWPVTNTAGDACLKSPFMEDLEALFVSLPLQKSGTPSHAVLPDPRLCGSARDARNHILDAQCDSDGAHVAGLDAARAGAAVERARYAPGAFDAYDGVITAPAAIGRLRERFNGDHRFSATELQAYLNCPFRFFLERILKVKTLDEPDEGIDPMLRGLILHDALEAFYRQRRGKPLELTMDALAEQELSRALDDAFERLSARIVQTPPAVVAVEKVRLMRRLLRFIKWSAEEDLNAGWSPSHFEVQFGRRSGANGDPLSTPAPYRLETEAGPILIQGTIDRIDCNDHQLRVIDYKSGNVPALAVLKNGSEIQLSLYAMAAAEHLLPDYALQSALYWSPGRTGNSDGRRDALRGQQWTVDDALAMVPESVSAAVTGMRSGNFSLKAAGTRCVGCPNGKVCRFEEGRIDRKAQ